VETVTGTGCANNKNAAKKYALADLSSQIRVRVESELYMAKKQYGAKYGDYTSYKIRLTSDLNIYEYSINYTERDGGFCADVFIPHDKISLYQSKAVSLVKEIDAYTGKADTVKLDSQKADLLHKALSKYNELDDVSVIVRFLGAIPPKPEKERAITEEDMIRMQRVSSDITQIAKNIMSRLNSKKAYVNPVQLHGSSAVTPFAAILTQQMRAYGVKNKDAPYQLYCQYSPEGDPFIISCDLKFRGVTESAFVTAAGAEVCNQVNCKSSALIKNIEQIFGSPGGGLFRGYFYTDYGDSGVMLREGDILTLYARVSEAADIAVFHNDGVKTSLLPLSKTGPVIKISEKHINTETELIKLKTAPPFGADTLIFIAYRGDFCELIPCRNGEQKIADNIDTEKLSAKLRELPKDKYIEKVIVFNTEPAR
jgi:hypothetical protein